MSTNRLSVRLALLVLGLFASTASAQAVQVTSISADPSTLWQIPDGIGCPQMPGPPRDVTFTVSGLTGVVQRVFVENVQVSHPYLGDVLVELIAPDGASHDIFGFTGATPEDPHGSRAGIFGPYIFADLATTSWWTTAASVGSGQMPSGVYRTSHRGGSADTSMDPVFNQKQPNGIWRLRFRDTCFSDGVHGFVFAATLTLTTIADVQAPTGLVVSAVAGNTVTLRWNTPAIGPPATGYVLEGGVSPGQVLASIPTGSASPIFTFTAPTGSYLVRVHAEVAGQKSGPSNEIQLNVSVPVAPSAPINFLASAHGSTLDLAWKNTFGGGAPQSVVLDVSGSPPGSLSLGLRDSISFDNVPGGTYNLSVRSTNAAGTSSASNVVTVTLPGACLSAPQPPSNFLAYPLGGTLFLVWDPGTSGPAPTGFVLHASGAFTGNVATTARTLNGAVGPGTYHFSVSATNACGASAATSIQTVIIP